MVTFIGKEDTLEGLLSNLIKLDFDAAEAYEAAINRLECKEYKEQFRIFHNDHLDHTKTLNDILKNMGKNIQTGPDLKQYLTQGKVVLAGLISDKAILQAMKTNEDDTNKAYENALNHKEVNFEVRPILQKNLEDEKRHRDWIVSAIKREKL